MVHFANKLKSYLSFVPLHNFKFARELSVALPELIPMASPSVHDGKRMHPLSYYGDLNQSRVSLFYLMMSYFLACQHFNYMIIILVFFF